MGSTEPFAERFALALETSTPRAACAIGRGATILETRYEEQGSRHSTALLPAVDELCRRHGVSPGEIGFVFVSSGPGSFTGLRLGITVARMLALGGGARLVEVPTCEVIAHSVSAAPNPPPHLAVLIDAHRGHVFAATYQRIEGRWVEEQPAAELDPRAALADLARTGGRCAVVGEGARLHAGLIDASAFDRLDERFDRPRVESVYALGAAKAAAGQFIAPRDFVPRYVRAPDAEEKLSRRTAASPPG